MHQLAALGDLALDRIEAQLADLDGRVFSPRRRADAANRAADAGDQLARAEGFGDIVVRAQFERLHLILLLVAHRQHQDRQPGGKGANAAQRLYAADTGHIHVEQDGVEDARAQGLQRLFAARGLHHLKAEFDERWTQRPADGRFIIDDKNANHWLVHQEDSFRAEAGMAAKNVVPFTSSLVTQT